jgi:hypothetical protein
MQRRAAAVTDAIEACVALGVDMSAYQQSTQRGFSIETSTESRAFYHAIGVDLHSGTSTLQCCATTIVESIETITRRKKNHECKHANDGRMRNDYRSSVGMALTGIASWCCCGGEVESADGRAAWSSPGNVV